MTAGVGTRPANNPLRICVLYNDKQDIAYRTNSMLDAMSHCEFKVLEEGSPVYNAIIHEQKDDGSLEEIAYFHRNHNGWMMLEERIT